MTPPFFYQFAVFTPTYNRSHTLHRVYESLVAQTYSEFEWLVIDDGSTDDTRSCIEAWQTIAPFKIRYIYQSPQGKHAAYHRAAIEFKGEFLICLDSDDLCLPYALERMSAQWDEISVSDQSRYSGIDCHCIDDQEGHKIGTDYPSDGFMSNYPEMRYPVLYVNECWRVYQQEIPPDKLQLDKLQLNDVQPTIEGSGQLTKQKLTVRNPVESLLLNQTLLNISR